MLGYISSDRPRLMLRAHRWTSRGAAVVGAASLALTTATVAPAARFTRGPKGRHTAIRPTRASHGQHRPHVEDIAADFNKDRSH